MAVEIVLPRQVYAEFANAIASVDRMCATKTRDGSYGVLLLTACYAREIVVSAEKPKDANDQT